MVKFKKRLWIMTLAVFLFSSPAFSYLLSSGQPLKGIFWRDLWGEVWFLPHGQSVSREVADKAKDRIGRPVVFTLTESWHNMDMPTYWKGEISSFPDGEEESNKVSLVATLEGDILCIRMEYFGTGEFNAHDTFLLWSSEPSQGTGLRYLPGFTYNTTPVFLKAGEGHIFRVPLSEIKKTLSLAQGKHQIIASYCNWNSDANVYVISNALELEIK